MRECGITQYFDKGAASCGAFIFMKKDIRYYMKIVDKDKQVCYNILVNKLSALIRSLRACG